MRIAVTTPSGRVESTVTDFLLDFGGNVQVRLLGRRADKLADSIKRGAETVIGSQTTSIISVRPRKASTPSSGRRLQATVPTTCGHFRTTLGAAAQRR